MNRIEELIKEITLYLKDNDMDESYIMRDDDISIRLTNLMNITSEVSIITIESIEDVSDRWGQITGHKRVDGSIDGYTIILSSNAERLDIQSVSDLAEVIKEYEDLFNSLTLLKDE